MKGRRDMRRRESRARASFETPATGISSFSTDAVDPARLGPSGPVPVANQILILTQNTTTTTAEPHNLQCYESQQQLVLPETSTLAYDWCGYQKRERLGCKWSRSSTRTRTSLDASFRHLAKWSWRRGGPSIGAETGCGGRRVKGKGAVQCGWCGE